MPAPYPQWNNPNQDDRRPAQWQQTPIPYTPPLPKWQVPLGPPSPIPMPPSLNIPGAFNQPPSTSGALGGINPAFTPPKPTPKPIPVTKAYAFTVGGPEIVKPGYEMMSMQGQTGYYAPYKMTLANGKAAWVLKYFRQPYAPTAKPPAPATPPAGGGDYGGYSQGWGSGSYTYKQPKQKSTWYIELINWNFERV